MYLADRAQTLDALLQRPSHHTSLFSPEQPGQREGGITRASHMDNYEFWCCFTEFVNVASTMPYESYVLVMTIFSDIILLLLSEK